MSFVYGSCKLGQNVCVCVFFCWVRVCVNVRDTQEFVTQNVTDGNVQFAFQL